MQAREFIDFIDKVEKLKTNTRHSVTADNVPESVAAHSWRLSLMAYLLTNDLPDVDMSKVLKMCIIHDIGEAITGDIPSFHKSVTDEQVEQQAIRDLLASYPNKTMKEMQILFDEMDALETKESKVFKALDKMEAVIQHNEAPIESWIPEEYGYQMSYGVEESKVSPIIEEIRLEVLSDSKQKIENNR